MIHRKTLPGKDKKKLSPNEAIHKLYKFCGWQERCKSEVSKKLYEWGIDKDDFKEIIDRLVNENYIDEARYARAFVRGKFGMKKWGIQKITIGLKQKGISADIIQEALKEIPENEYEEILKKLIRQKANSLRDTDPFKKKYKIAKYMVGKGYNPEAVWSVLNEES